VEEDKRRGRTTAGRARVGQARENEDMLSWLSEWVSGRIGWLCEEFQRVIYIRAYHGPHCPPNGHIWVNMLNFISVSVFTR